MRYQKIYVQIWNDEKFIQLSEASKVFFLYLLTSPHSNLIGAFVLKKGYVAEDLNWSMQKVDRAIKEGEKSGLLVFDKKVSVIIINNYLKYNPLENPNQFTGASNIFYTLPKTEILMSIFNKLETLSKRFNRPFETASKPEAVTEAVTETDSETVTVEEAKKISVDDIVQGWNGICGENGFPKVASVTPDRRKKVNLRLKVHKDKDFWGKVFNLIVDTPFLSGKNDRQWTVKFDWLFANDENATKIFEGNYERSK